MQRLIAACTLSSVLVIVVAVLVSGCAGVSSSANNGPGTNPFAPGNSPGASPTPASSPTPSPTPTPTPSPTPTKLVTRFAYLALESPQVQGFSVDPNTGTTMPLSQGPVPVGEGFCATLAADQAGRFLYVSCPSSNAHGNQIGRDELGGFRIDQASGSLTPIPGSPINLNQLNQQAGSIVVSPDGKFLYMSVQGILVFSIDQNTGALALLPGSPFVPPETNTLDARGLAIAPSGRFLYVTQNGNAGQQGQIAVYSLSPATGIPSPVAGSPFKTETLFFPDAIAADPLGRFLYSGGGNARPNVDVQQIHSNGTLSPAPGSPFSSADTALFIAAEPSGKFLYVFAGIGSSAGVFAYGVDSISGALTPVPGSPFARGVGAGGLTADQTGKFLYIGTSHGLLGYTIDPGSGSLTEIPGNPPTRSGFDNGVITVAY